MREFALCYSRHPGDMRGRSRVWTALQETDPRSAGSAGSESQNRSVVWASRFKKVPFLRAPTPPQTLPQERFSQAIGWLCQPASQASEWDSGIRHLGSGIQHPASGIRGWDSGGLGSGICDLWGGGGSFLQFYIHKLPIDRLSGCYLYIIFDIYILYNL